MEKTGKRWLVGGTAAACVFGGMLFLASYVGIAETPLFCKGGLSSNTGAFLSKGSYSAETTIQLLTAIVHYATSSVVPQQTLDEIRVTFDVLKAKFPCNFLVFGLGHDSIMWASLNPGGTTLFLEEDPNWFHAVLREAPYLRAYTVKYRTQLSEADDLLKQYLTQPDCSPQKSFLRGNERCKLALNMLPDEVYDKEWDLIMIDAPRGYSAELPGRMAAIYSVAVMARNRKGSGVTHVFLHDVDRKVEKVYAETFLCSKNRVNYTGKLWHFEIPPATDSNPNFC